MSTTVTERLVSHCNKNLIKDVLTRWSFVAKRLLQVKSPLAKVLQELEWNNLPTSDWVHLENVHRLLMKPFAQYTYISYKWRGVWHPIINHPSCDGVVTASRRHEEDTTCGNVHPRKL